MPTEAEPNYNNVYIPPMPPDTPLVVPYPNLNSSTQHKRNNFESRRGKRSLRRVVSNQEDAASLTRVLQKYWGYDTWRGPQLDICKAAMEGQDILLVAPTGLGKSACFQVPAVTMEYGITIVISPLLALMKDQVMSLQKKGIKAAMLYEKSAFCDISYIKQQLKMGHPELRLLYITPETLFGVKIELELVIAYNQKQINRLIIDEAHVIEEWGRTFRSAYRDLGKFREKFPSVPITAVTASATEEVRADILCTLGMTKDNLFQRVEPFNRKNLFYEVRYQTDLNASVRQANLANFIATYRPDAQKRNAKHGIKGSVVSGLVYCRKRSTCNEVSHFLCSRGIRSLAFHAEMSDGKRQRVLEAWIMGEVECIVATIAFGMGVDQPHVRYVVHYDMPSSFEGYYQETGRAGRDGHLSRCIMYYSREDALVIRSLIEREARNQAAKRVKAGENAEQVTADSAKANSRTINSFKLLQFYAEETRQCRHMAVCRYFGEKIDATDEQVREAYCNKTCDVCSNPAAVRRRAMILTEDKEIASQPVPTTFAPSAAPRPFVKVMSRITECSESTSGYRPSRRAGPSPDTIASVVALHGDQIQLQSGDEACPHFSSPSSAKSGTRVPQMHDGPQKLCGSPTGGEDDFEMPSSPSPRSRSFLQPAAGPHVEDGFDVEAFLEDQKEPAAGDVEDGQSQDGSGTVAEVHEPIAPRAIISKKAYSPAQFDRLPRQAPITPAGARRPFDFVGNDRNRHETHRGKSVYSLRTPGKYVRTGHPALANISARKGATMSDLTEGQYATPDRLPEDKEKRQRQQEAFKAVTPITGRGPFSYYTNTAAPMTGRKRKLSTANEAGLGFRPPFKPPLFKEEKERVGLISRDKRIEAIATLKEALRKSLVEGPEANRLWRFWGEPKPGRKAATRAAAVEIEALVVKDCVTPEMFADQIGEVVNSIRILRSKEGAKIVAGGRLGEYEGDEYGRWLMLVGHVVRTVSVL